MTTQPPDAEAQFDTTTSHENSSLPWLLTLDQIDGSTLPLVGGKAFRLALLKQHGFNVPPGLVLTTHFFETHIRHEKLVPLWAGSPDIAVTSESLTWLSDTLKTKPLTPQLFEALNTYMAASFDPDIELFAVRSSIIDEDQYDSTFAGVHLTELGVPRSAIVIAITRCWASALQEPAVQYRQAHGMSIQSIRPAVLIQPMLKPQSAGVGFTLNPLTGARDEFVIEATWGLGSRLVSGAVQPYRYHLSSQPPNYTLIAQHSPDDTSAGADNSEQWPLSPQAAVDLAHYLGQIQALMGEAQDIEWALQDDTFYILQSRPVTTSLETELSLNRQWSRARYPDLLPELPSPLFGAFLERAQPQLLSFFKELGFDVDGPGPYEQIIFGRPYVNLTLLRKLFVQVGLQPETVLQAMGYIQSTTITNKIFSIDWQTAWRACPVFVATVKQALSLKKDFKNVKTLVNDVVSMIETHADPSRGAMLNQLQQQVKVYQILSITALKIAISIGAVSVIGSRLLAAISKMPIHTLQLLALKEIKTSRILLDESLVRLSNVARQDEQAVDYFSNIQNPGDDQALSLPAKFQTDFDDLLTQFGHRATFEADPGWPRYADDPTPLLQIIGQQVNSDQFIEAHGATISWQSLTDAPRGLDRLLPWRRWLTSPFIFILRRILRLRNELEDIRAEFINAVRGWYLVLGRRWAKHGWVEHEQDIFWLTLTEIEQAVMREDDPAVTLAATVQARKEIYQSYAKTQLPPLLTDTQIPQIQVGVGVSPGAPTDVIIGLPISPGQTQGTVMVVHHPDEFKQIVNKNIIFVIPSTDPIWLAQLHLAAGLIVETGGLLSHGSIIAREYGLPAVANIPQATQRFQTGDTVLVDGSTGVVQLLELATAREDSPKKTS